MGAAILPAPQAVPQEILQKIEVLVNDEIISAYDLRQRLGLVIISTGGVSNQEELDRLTEQVLKSMVDERLQLQEAASFELVIPEAQLEDAFQRVAANFGQTPQQFDATLVQYGSSRRSLFDQLRAEFAWQELVRGRLGVQVVISDEEVEATLDQMEENTGKFEYRISEIYLIVDIPSRDTFVLQRAQRLIQQMNDGAQFQAVARQFSESATAARGGDLGWMAEGRMALEIETAVRNMDVLDVSPPIRSAGGYYVVQLRDRRRILSADPLDLELEVHQIAYTFDPESTRELTDAWIIKANAVRANYNGCEFIPQMAEELGVTTFGSAGFISLRNLGAELRGQLEPLEIGVPSPPVASADAIRIFFVCSKRQPEIEKPSFDVVFGQLEEQRLAMMARRYLRDLRRDSIVDYR